MAGVARPKTLLAIAVAFAGEGVILAQQAWVSSPRLHVPSSVAFIVAGALLVGAAMIALQVAGVERWNDLLAAALLAGFTAESFWETFGSGARPCRIGWWQPPEGVCRTGLGVGTLACAAMTVWAAARFMASRKRPAQPTQS